MEFEEAVKARIAKIKEGLGLGHDYISEDFIFSKFQSNKSHADVERSK